MIARRLRVIPAAVLMVSAALAAPAAANASSSWVSASAAVGSDSSCSSPGFNTVQAAITAAASGGTIEVCGGTYTEQIEITKPLKLLHSGSPATLALPSTPVPSETSCDTAEGLEPGQIDEVSVCTTGKVSIKGLQIDALAPIETCAGGLYGIFVGGGAQLTASVDTIDGASTTLAAFKGCQHGVAIEAGSAKADEVGHVVLYADTISGYEKNGPTAAFTGSSLKMTSSEVTGEGPSPYIAQNGVEVAFGAKGKIERSKVSGNECELAGVCGSTNLESQATGVLFYGAASGSAVSNTTITQNDIGIYYGSTSATQPTKPEVKASEDHLVSNRYEGVLLEEGDASLSELTINGTGQTGIGIVQSGSQPYANDSSTKDDTIEGMSVAAVQVFTDGAPTDPAGTFKLSDSSISKNATAVLDPSTNFTVKQKDNT